MIEYSEAIIRKIIFHRFSLENSKVFVSEKSYDYHHGDDEETLKRIFLKPFSNITTTHEFSHHIDVTLNPLYKISKEVYDGGDFEKHSKDVFNHLQSVSKHQNIKDGEVFILQLEDIKYNDKYYEALAIHKVESKESYLNTFSETSGKSGLFFKKGIGSKKVDKACLIIFTESNYTVFIIDNGGGETDFWKNEFVKATLKKDAVNSTNHFLTIAKSFVTDQLPTEYETTKAQQVDLLSKSLDYFKSRNAFNKAEFEETVLGDEDLISSFRKFDKSYRVESGFEIADKFEISAPAVKKQQRIFKGVIKLDKNFHIYVHGDSALIEHGVEKDGRKFYKIYYEEES